MVTAPLQAIANRGRVVRQTWQILVMALVALGRRRLASPSMSVPFWTVGNLQRTSLTAGPYGTEDVIPMRFIDFVRPLSRLFRSTPPIPPVTEARVATLDSAAPEFIIATALHDGEEGVRTAAIRMLQDGDTLRTMGGLHKNTSLSVPSSVERVAQERVAQLIDEGTIDFSELCMTARNSSAMLAVAGLCSNAARLSQGLA